MNRSMGLLIILVVFIPSVMAETTTDYQPVSETITTGTTTGFGLLADNDGSNWVGTETGSPMTLNVTHDLDNRVAFGDLVYVEIRVRGFNSGEAFSLSVRDWQQSLYVLVLTIGATISSEQLFTRSLDFTCGSGSNDCLVNPNRDAVAVSLRWNDAGGADAVSNTLTLDQEIIRFVKTEQSSSSAEWTLRVGVVFFFILLIAAFAGKMPPLMILAGILLAFLSFPALDVTESIALFLIFLFGGLMLILIGVVATAAGGYAEA